METQTHETTPILLAVRSFRINVAQEALVDLRRRVAATRWPGRSWREGDGGHTLCPPSPATHGTSDVAINLISYQLAFSRSKCPRGAQRA
jgi:hypothetical protein